jgi:hypothetical protein
MRMYSYVLRTDRGFAPNPFWGYCTLACCKPVIRKMAVIGDWIVGTGSVNNAGSEKLIYAMKVTGKKTLEQYARDERFQNKIPRQGVREERGDNIYYKNTTGCWVQRYSYHSIGTEKVIQTSIKRDLKGEYVLISGHYFYFGKNAITIPQGLREIINGGHPGHKSRSIPSSVIATFEEWIDTQPRGKQGDPHDFREILYKERHGEDNERTHFACGN